MSSFHPRILSSRKTLASAIALLGGACSFSGFSQAAGFALNESSASAAGTAFAGRVAAPQDAAALAANPAAISFLNAETWTVGGALIAPVGSLKNTKATPMPVLPPADDGEPFVSPVFVPSAYLVKPLTEQWALGFGVYVPFGLETDYNTDFVGRYLALKSHVQNVNYQPTLSYKFSDTMSFGIGFIASHIEGTLSQMKATPAGGGNYLGIDVAKSTVKGSAWQVAAKIGALWDDGVTSLGIAWTSNTDFNMKGTVKLEPTAAGEAGKIVQSKADGHLKLKTPQSVEFGGSHKFSDSFTVMAGAMWTGWKSFKEIKIVLDEDLNAGAVSYPSGSVISYVPEKWKNVWAFSLGGQYQICKEWLLRAGYAYDESPTSDKYRTARIPDGDRNWVTVGARYQPAQEWDLDLAYGYMIPKTNKVNESTHTYGESKGGEPTYSGKYKMSAHIAMAALSYRY
ncbi:OmpP1/FadL family transporter [Parendozoicomonas haliclonae]|uniref:47 kDa outer membrane protein n=1 Tax=Parendozoicomonas haliclonae TaxID=1960125 RepID=A0A1X7AF98_9GAMM|nr:outer membrane protein transport protein [Parendozoicomonas haliclonae]SMA37074.1 47 kDa outer membrane protein precursor [Parendozoicomonas haliclonae]